MTVREAMTIACRELGYSEDQIRNSQRFASLRTPNLEVDEPLKFKPGMTERDLIDGLKASLIKMEQFTPEQRRQFNEALEQRHREAQKDN